MVEGVNFANWFQWRSLCSSSAGGTSQPDHFYRYFMRRTSPAGIYIPINQEKILFSPPFVLVFNHRAAVPPTNNPQDQFLFLAGHLEHKYPPPGRGEKLS